MPSDHAETRISFRGCLCLWDWGISLTRARARARTHAPTCTRTHKRVSNVCARVCVYTCVCVRACVCCAQARVCICSSCKALYRFLMLIDNLGTYSLLEWHSSLAPSLPFSADFFLPTPLVTHSGLPTPDPYHRLGLRELYSRRAAVRRKRTAWPVRV